MTSKNHQTNPFFRFTFNRVCTLIMAIAALASAKPVLWPMIEAGMDADSHFKSQDARADKMEHQVSEIRRVLKAHWPDAEWDDVSVTETPRFPVPDYPAPTQSQQFQFGFSPSASFSKKSNQ